MTEWAPRKISDDGTMYQKNLKQVLMEPIASLNRGEVNVEQGLEEEGRPDVADPVDTEVNIDSNVQINDNNASNVPVVVNIQNTDGRPKRTKKKPNKLDL